ncbi:hypothetical protein I8748_04745 [Nostoc sp. CENA67]|uniref:Uncharacterized protein n=1 Tax=Amazonocrinis nigriterrae CENA67 TaxID=2794033 RepID=A0A8J7HKX9_9NOST|nr:hypothetical protein [Amazonocrinis nigriterrae]MBH8561491.1 hypothetical protein [Amazonocrinis nigriterrae CENA67]
MSRKSKIAVATILILAIAGCASEETPQAINPVPPPPAVTKSPPKTQSLVAKPPSKTQSFNDPLVANAKKAPTGNSASTNLIQLTNPTERAILVTKGRIDPFAQIIGQTVPQMPTNTVVKQVPKLPPLPTVFKTARKLPTPNTVVAKNTTVKTQKLKPNPVLAQVLPKVLPQVVPNPTLVSVLPPPAQPETARAAFVSGVVLIGKEPQAIIKMPNEQTSRYVQTGQRLANGVLIKRIEMNQGSNPIVILEQYGIEVAKMVGEAPAGSTPSGTTPVSVTTPPPNSVIVGAS